MRASRRAEGPDEGSERSGPHGEGASRYATGLGSAGRHGRHARRHRCGTRAVALPRPAPCARRCRHGPPEQYRVSAVRAPVGGRRGWWWVRVREGRWSCCAARAIAHATARTTIEARRGTPFPNESDARCDVAAADAPDGMGGICDAVGCVLQLDGEFRAPLLRGTRAHVTGPAIGARASNAHRRPPGNRRSCNPPRRIPDA